MAERTDRLGELYAAHAPEAARLAFLLTGNREDARDLTQDAFAICLRRFCDIRDRDAFPAYLRTTLVNLCRRHFRKARVQRAYLEREHARPGRPSEFPDVERQDELWRAVLSLPYRQRAAIVLRYYEDLSEQQAAEALNCSLPALKSLVARGTQSLRETIAREA